MVSPQRRREAVTHACHRLGASQRRACRVLEQARSSQNYQRKQPVKDRELIKAIERLSRKHSRAGCRMVTRYLRREGWKVNSKRVHRIWKQEGLRVPQRVKKKRRLGASEQGSQRRRAERINQVWSYDFVFDQTQDGRVLKWLPVLDEYSRENLALEVERNLKAKDIIKVLDRIVGLRGAPEYIRSDNGPEFVAKEVKAWILQRGFKTLYIEPGSPWQNAYCESFNARLRDELLNVEAFGSLLEAKVLAKEHQDSYNYTRPHSSLGDKTPAEFAEHCLASLRATPFAAPNNELT
jgi:putative transposase